MIVAYLTNIAKQAALSPRLRDALNFLQQTPLQSLAVGRVEIEGGQVYALVQSYNSRLEAGQPCFEAHRRYVDVQYVVSGVELIGWAPLERLTVTMPYNIEKDVLLGTVDAAEQTLVRLTAGQVAILYPSDAHAPGLAAGVSEAVKKVVVKLLLDDE